LLKHVVHDPALLVWLDAQANRKGHPNENLSRELMELFTLGIGHYTESDVQEAARALTGWTVVSDHFREDSSLHDDGEMTILSQKGRWKGDSPVPGAVPEAGCRGSCAARKLSGRNGWHVHARLFRSMLSMEARPLLNLVVERRRRMTDKCLN
jgi:uncharacterized protein (DUF1800 family)